MRDIRVGTINGGNNQFNQYNISNSNREGKSSTKLGGEVFAVASAAVLVSVYLYLRHFEVIFFYAQIGTFTAMLLHLATLVPQWHDPDYQFRNSLLMLIGALLALTQYWLAVNAQSAMPTEVIDLANQPTTATGLLPSAWEVWQRFDDREHRFILENFMAALILMPAILFSTLFGLQHFLASTARAAQHQTLALVARWLRFARVEGLYLNVFLTATALLLHSGVISLSAR